MEALLVGRVTIVSFVGGLVSAVDTRPGLSAKAVDRVSRLFPVEIVLVGGRAHAPLVEVPIVALIGI